MYKQSYLGLEASGVLDDQLDRVLAVLQDRKTLLEYMHVLFSSESMVKQIQELLATQGSAEHSMVQSILKHKRTTVKSVKREKGEKREKRENPPTPPALTTHRLLRVQKLPID